MGNQTSEENWAARERLLSIERMLWWRGHVGRPDLRELFGLSPAQASSDLQKYQELNAGAMAYQVNRKRYEALPGMRPLLEEPRFEMAVRLFLGGGVMAGGPPVSDDGVVAEVALPYRAARPEVEQGVVRALAGGRRLALRYRAVRPSDGRSGGERWLAPTRLVWDGTRWHLRGWCELRERYADFVLSRIERVIAVGDAVGDLPVDEDWETWEVLELKPNPGLGEEGVAALKFDYDLGRKRSLKLRVRRALKPYLRERMGVVGEGAERFWGEM